MENSVIPSLVAGVVDEVPSKILGGCEDLPATKPVRFHRRASPRSERLGTRSSRQASAVLLVLLILRSPYSVHDNTPDMRCDQSTEYPLCKKSRVSNLAAWTGAGVCRSWILSGHPPAAFRPLR
jgi:hypothetical protein